MRDVYLVDGARSPIGRYGGRLASMRATHVASTVATAVLDRCGLPATEIDFVVGGMVLQDMTESNPARIVSERVGIGHAAAAFTINMQCASGMAAVLMAAEAVAHGRADSAMAVAMESMSGAPYMVRGPRWGLKLGHAQFTDTLEECKLAGSAMWDDPWNMIDVAENHAHIDGISRAEMDEYAVLSHRRAVLAADSGAFAPEIIPIPIQSRDGPGFFERDEHPRRDVSMDTLGALQPIRDGGVITAGNAAGQNDGAAVAIVACEEDVRRLGLSPIARLNLRGSSLVGCDPHVMGYSAVDAAEDALRRADLTLADIDLIECNEGFAVQMVACARKGQWPVERLNVEGGSVALGHPVGMSGLRIVIHLAHALRRHGLARGLATVPAGSGLGAAVIVDRCGA